MVGFLALVKPGLAVEALPIDDGAGPTITRPEFQAIVASSETLSGCRWINSVRAGKGDGWAPLRIVLIARTNEGNLSSTAIRRWKHERRQAEVQKNAHHGGDEGSKM